MTKKKHKPTEKETSPEFRGTPPAWAPGDAGPEFASRVVQPPRDEPPSSGTSRRKKRPARLSTEEYVQGVLRSDRTILARAITLVESNHPEHFRQARQVLQKLLPHTGNSLRVGITGIPGAGKSTFIEALGTLLTEQGKGVAVLAVDPTSALTRGSILGDKTRMEKLTRNPRCFIRPSPSGGALGGVSRKTRETILLCEAAGFPVILVETVGIGQNEITVRGMVDFFLLLMVTGTGDELQGIKKGVVELADAVVFNKADGENELPARRAAQDFNQTLHYLSPATEGWETRAFTCSSLTGAGVAEIWRVIEDFRSTTAASGIFQQRRRHQLLEWLRSGIGESLLHRFHNHPEVKKHLPRLETEVLDGKLPPDSAAEELIDLFLRNPGR